MDKINSFLFVELRCKKPVNLRKCTLTKILSVPYKEKKKKNLNL